MDSETIDAVTDWGTVPVEDGYRGLRALADAEFTGGVTDGRAWAFVLNGRVIGVFGGDVTAFENADLTAYEAPDPALPLLYAMRERGGETQAKYYTQQMALAEADETLRSGGFTGYVRLSENVLSGDYYVVYHGGKSMSVAFVGTSRRLLTGDEAFERANDEVGIYEVIAADVDVVDLPDAPEAEPESESRPETGTDPVAGAETEVRPDDVDATDAEADTETADATARNATLDRVDADADEGTDGASDAEPTAASDDDPSGPTSVEADAGAAPTDDADDSPAAGAPSESPESPDAPERDDADEASDDDGADDARDEPSERPERPTAEGAEAPTSRPAPSPAEATEAAATDDADASDDVFSEEEEWREARAIPSLDPAQTEGERSDAGRRATAAEAKTRSRDDAAAARQRRPPSPPQSVSRSSGDDSGPRSSSDPRSSGTTSRSGRAGSNAGSGAPSSPSSGSEPESESTDADLRERLAEATAVRERLESQRDELEAERDEYREEAARLASKVNALETEIERLESALADASAAAGDGSDAPDRTMAAAEALSGTNLFVRYASKADPTLEDAHGGDARRDEVNDNLRVEHHTQFDTEGLRVEGRPFEEYLRDTTEYRFVEWVVRDLLYDVQTTRTRSELGDLYDAIPRIDRAEIGGTVSAAVGESGGADGDEAADADRETAFDVVLWDGRGNPLLVANLNTSRDPATESMVTSLISDASDVGEGHDTLGAAFYVTASYFEPGALDAVGDATGGGLLSRSKRRSYVKLARKQGFHLCLVEARNREFHVSVPDL